MSISKVIVPDHVQPPAVPPPQLLQEGNRGPGVAVALQVHPLHLPSLQAHRRVVADLLPNGGILRKEGLPPRFIGLEQALLGTLVAESQPMQVIQATAAAQVDGEPFPDKPPHHPPIPGPTTSAIVAPPPSTPPVSLGRGRGGTAGLLEYQCLGTSLTEGRCPPSYDVRVPVSIIGLATRCMWLVSGHVFPAIWLPPVLSA